MDESDKMELSKHESVCILFLAHYCFAYIHFDMDKR